MNKCHTYLRIVAITAIFNALAISCAGPSPRQIVFTEHPGMKIGFSTQNFMKAMPFGVGSLQELIHYAKVKGFQFIEVRDNLAELSSEACRTIKQVADQSGIELIYEINVNLLDPVFPEVFERGLRNCVEIGGPGILRVAGARSEFEKDPKKIGWSMEELTAASVMAENCAILAREEGITFVVENLIEPFIGDAPYYYGISDLFVHTEQVGMQFDICNPFATISRKKAAPEEVVSFLKTLGARWVTTHFKTSIDGVAQPVLGDNPLSIEEVLALMGKMDVEYFSLELVAAETIEECYENHFRSIKYLKESGFVN